MSVSGSNPRVRLQKPGAKFNAFVSVILSITLVTNVSFMQVTSAYAETGTTNQTQPNKASADTEKTSSSAADALSMLDAAEADLNADNTSSAFTDAAKYVASTAETTTHAESDVAANDAKAPEVIDTSDAASESADAPKEDLGEMKMKRSLSATPEGADITPSANDKITISNVALSDHEIFESRDGSLPISVSFDWEGKGLVQGDTLVIPMSDAFDSITKNVVFTFGTADVPEVGTLTLDYNARKIITKFTADMDPHKIYHGRVKIGTFVSRDYFTEIDSTKTIDIPGNAGSNQAQLRVVYDYLNQSDPRYGASFGRVYVRAIEETMSEDQHESDVLWAGIINQRNNQMINPEVYASSSIISDISVSNWTGEREVKLFYNDTAYPSYTMDESTFKVYEADVSDSMGYTRGKELVYGKDFTFERSLPDGSDGYTLKFIGDYANTDKSIVFEGVAHYTDLQITDDSDDRGASATEIAGSAAIVYDTTSGAVIGDTNGALITVNNSSVTNITSDEPPAPDKGSVTVIHVAKDTGKLLKDEEYVQKDQPVGTAYTTTQEQFEGYTFAGMGPKSADAEGTVELGTKTVIYLYDPKAPEPEQKTGNVDVKYVDENGVVLPGGDLTVVKENAPVGEEYTTEKKSFEGYEFKGMDEMSSPVRGNVIEGEQHVIYVYAPIPEVKTGSVDVKYIDKETGEEISGGKLSSVKENAPAGDTYTTEQKDFEGYTFSGMDVTSASANGSVIADETLHVIYTYTKNPEPVIIKGSVDVKYITTKGDTLEDTTSVIDNEEVGTAYTTDEKTFEGYSFVGMDKTSAPSEGSVIEGIQHVIYVYAPIPEVKTGSVDVTYMTEDGSILQQSIVKHNAPVDEAYETDQKSFEGYTFKEMDLKSAPANGVVTEGIQHVIYIYTDYSSKNAPETGSVDVKYIADDGTVLKDTETVKDTAPAGEKYTTEQKDFEGYTFKGLDVTSAAVNGQVIANETLHIIYVYEKNETPKDAKGSVDVTYVTTDGKTLKDTEVVKDNVHVGTKYTTTEETFEGYTFVGMDKASAPAEGSVIEGTQHVVYTYTAEKASNDPKQGDVVVYYIDKNGTVLHSGIVKENVNYGTDYSTDQLEFKGYTFKQMKEGSDPVKGKVNKALTTITYVYTQDTQNPPAPKPDIIPGTPEDETPGPEAVIQEILPKTADEMPITLALSLSLLALIGLGAIALRRKHLAEAAEHVE